MAFSIARSGMQGKGNLLLTGFAAYDCHSPTCRHAHKPRPDDFPSASGSADLDPCFSPSFSKSPYESAEAGPSSGIGDWDPSFPVSKCKHKLLSPQTRFSLLTLNRKPHGRPPPCTPSPRTPASSTHTKSRAFGHYREREWPNGFGTDCWGGHRGMMRKGRFLVRGRCRYRGIRSWRSSRQRGRISCRHSEPQRQRWSLARGMRWSAGRSDLGRWGSMGEPPS